MLILGHRGAVVEDGAFYQNSKNAFQEALSAADGFETDACVDADGEVFLIHEAKYVDPAQGVDYCAAEHLDSVSAAILGNRRIDQMTTAEVKNLRLKDGSPLPLLREALTLTGRYPQGLIDIELKGHEAVTPVMRLVDDAVRQRRIRIDAVVMTSFNHPALLTVREQMPAMRVGAIFVGEDVPAAPLYPWQPGSAGCYTPLTADCLQEATLREIQPEYFMLPEEFLTRATVDTVLSFYPAARLMAWVFTEKKNFDLPRLLARLVDLQSTGKIAAILVDNPRAFRKAWERVQNCY
jgi:glycerophosphoryl diester phosphodiesterase